MYLGSTQPEELIQCELCHRENHKVCALYVSGEKYCCKNCYDQMEIEKVPIAARNLPSSGCDKFISDFLINYEVVPSEKIVIRLLSSVDRQMSTKYQVRSSKSGPNVFTYRDSKLFCFLETADANDVCFFSVHFQLHGDNSTRSSRRSVYISYIDSINVMPSPTKTLVYKFILLGLIKYLNKKGFERVYLWSCPPEKDDD